MAGDYIYGLLEFSFDVTGEKQIEQRLIGWMKRCEDWTPIFQGIEHILVEHLQSAFTTSGASTRAAWAPLSPAYARWKNKHYPGQPILTRTGALRQSLVGGGSGHVRELTPERGIL